MILRFGACPHPLDPCCFILYMFRLMSATDYCFTVYGELHTFVGMHNAQSEASPVFFTALFSMDDRGAAPPTLPAPASRP